MLRAGVEAGARGAAGMAGEADEEDEAGAAGAAGAPGAAGAKEMFSKEPQPKATNKQPTKEFVFVNFNAWECAACCLHLFAALPASIR